MNLNLTSLSEQQRQHLVSVLHDEVLQLDCQIVRLLQDTLTSTSLPAEVHENTVEALHLMKKSISYVRDITEKFSLPYIERESLVPALQDLLWQAEKRSGLCCSLITDGCMNRPPLPEEQERVLYSIAREAVMNVLQHARASVLRLSLSRMLTTLSLHIEDDGCGFVLPSPVVLSRKKHLGLNLIRERARQMGGMVILDSTPGKGSRLLIQMPVSNGESENENKQ
jgi:signal transduction histidine kinase